jgi:hypothetical protein
MRYNAWLNTMQKAAARTLGRRLFVGSNKTDLFEAREIEVRQGRN